MCILRFQLTTGELLYLHVDLFENAASPLGQLHQTLGVQQKKATPWHFSANQTEGKQINSLKRLFLKTSQLIPLKHLKTFNPYLDIHKLIDVSLIFRWYHHHREDRLGRLCCCDWSRTHHRRGDIFRIENLGLVAKIARVCRCTKVALVVWHRYLHLFAHFAIYRIGY